jgi:hypothetical protein
VGSRSAVAATVLIASAAIAFVPASPASAEPALGGPTAETTINDLRDRGYDVAINWVAGNSTSSLSKCTVVAIHNPNTGDADPTTFTTVYVDVSCPSQQAPVGIGVGIGF